MAIITIVSLLFVTKEILLLLIALGVVCLVPAGLNISKHLTTPTAFRRCDFKFIIGIGFLSVSIFCIVQIIQIIMI